MASDDMVRLLELPLNSILPGRWLLALYPNKKKGANRKYRDETEGRQDCSWMRGSLHSGYFANARSNLIY